MDRAGNREYIAPLFACKARGDERARRQRRLDNQYAADHSAQQTIAPRKILLERWRSRWILGKKRATHGDRARELAMARRIDAIEPGSDDGNRRTVAREGALVRGRIDTDRKSRDDGDACVGECRRECA